MGYFIARALTTALIVAATAGCQADSVTDVERTVASVTLGATSHTLSVGDSLRLSATARDSNGAVVDGARIGWSSSSAAVATVDSRGLVRALAAGSATITASSGGKSATAAITVGAGAPPPGSAVVDTIFYDGFETGSLAHWDDGVDPSRHRIVSGTGVARSGNGALEITYPAGNDGGWLTKFFMPGYDSVHVSLYVRYEESWTGGAKLIALYGSRTDNRWSAFGQAGRCPAGTDFFTTMLVTEPGLEYSTATQFYTYYPAMRREPDGATCWGASGDGTGTHHPPLSVTRGGWHRIEFSVKLNTPGQNDASQRYWIDGVLRGEWSGFAFRSSEILRLNAVQISANATPIQRVRRMYIDDILVTTARPQ